MFLDGKKKRLLDGDAAARCRRRPQALQFEKAARLRDEIHVLETLDDRGELDTHAQPEVFYIDPKKGLAGLQKVLKLADAPRTIEGVDIAHLGGGETVASLVQFIDGLPFKPGYRRLQDSRRARASTTSPASTRSSPAGSSGCTTRRSCSPTSLLIDGGKGQLNAALAAFRALEIDPADGDLAGQARGRDLRAGAVGAAPAEPALVRPAAAAVRPRRGPPLRPALPPHPAAEVDAGGVIGAVWSTRPGRQNRL